jgi:hypothetical protein
VETNIVVGSRVVLCGNYGKIGTVAKIVTSSNDKVCNVEWDDDKTRSHFITDLELLPEVEDKSAQLINSVADLILWFKLEPPSRAKKGVYIDSHIRNEFLLSNYQGRVNVDGTDRTILLSSAGNGVWLAKLWIS